MTPSDEIQASAGAYALNAMSESERTEFEAVLPGSEQLRSEVTELTDTAVELGLSVTPVDPPASLRASLLAAIAETPQLAPVVETVEVSRPETPAERKARSRWTSPLVRIGAVAAAVALIAGLGFTVRAGLQAQSDMTTASQINEIQAAEDYQRAVVDLDGGGTATLVWSGALERSALIVDGMKGLPAGSTYELWYIRADDAIPAGTFNMDDDGKHSIVLDGEMAAGDAVGVTIEPAGGSDTPTSAPILMVETA
jgi:anti-sigma-K factor RskA